MNIPEVVRIREVATGVEVDYITEVDEQFIDNQSFYYSMGNASCDCNRKLMFGYGHGIQFLDEWTPCGQGKYLVRVTIKGEVVYDELVDEKTLDTTTEV